MHNDSSFLAQIISSFQEFPAPFSAALHNTTELVKQGPCEA